MKLPFCCERKCNPCLEPENPLKGYGSDAADADEAISLARGSFGRVIGNPFESPELSPFAATGYSKGSAGFDLPPLGSDWKSQSCGDFVASPKGQESADLASARAGVECLVDEWPSTTPPNESTSRGLPERLLYSNSEVTYNLTCIDGTVFTYKVKAGQFVEFSQEQADAEALEFAKINAEKFHFCMGEISPSTCCLGSACSPTVTISGGQPPPDCEIQGVPFSPDSQPTFTFEVVSGSLPDGMSFQPFQDANTLAKEQGAAILEIHDQSLPSNLGGASPFPLQDQNNSTGTKDTSVLDPNDPQVQARVAVIVARGLSQNEIFILNQVQIVVGISGQISDSSYSGFLNSTPAFPIGTDLPGLGIYVGMDPDTNRPRFSPAGDPLKPFFNIPQYNVVYLAQQQILNP